MRFTKTTTISRTWEFQTTVILQLDNRPNNYLPITLGHVPTVIIATQRAGFRSTSAFAAGIANPSMTRLFCRIVVERLAISKKIKTANTNSAIFCAILELVRRAISTYKCLAFVESSLSVRHVTLVNVLSFLVKSYV